MENEIVIQQPAAVSTQQVTPMDMLNLAVQQGADLDRLEKLMALQERWEANEARKAYVVALSDFKVMGMIIEKDKHVSFQTQKGKTEYNHATLGNICNVIGAALGQHGLSFRWATEQGDGRIKVTCTLMHSMGHSESVSLEAYADESGGKNSIQAIGSAVSYLQRYTLLAITGTATQEQDDDSRGFRVGDVMDESELYDFISAIDAATTSKDIQKYYLPALMKASELKDQEAQDRLNVAKNNALERVNAK